MDGAARGLLGLLLLGLLLLLVIVAVLLAIVICHPTQRQPLFSLVRHPTICHVELMGCGGGAIIGRRTRTVRTILPFLLLLVVVVLLLLLHTTIKYSTSHAWTAPARSGGEASLKG